MSINKCILVGNVGNDPEVKHLESGTTVANFSLATSETYKTKEGEKVTNVEWHNVVCWKWVAEIVEKYVTKGQSLYLEGKIKTRSYDDKEGNKRYTTEIVADNLQMLGRKSDSNESNHTSSTTNNQQEKPMEQAPPPEEDDLPF
jgi:single-strand DNA-binding protein